MSATIIQELRCFRYKCSSDDIKAPAPLIPPAEVEKADADVSVGVEEVLGTLTTLGRLLISGVVATLPGVDKNFEFKFVAALNRLGFAKPEDWKDTLTLPGKDCGKCKKTFKSQR